MSLSEAFEVPLHWPRQGVVVMVDKNGTHFTLNGVPCDKDGKPLPHDEEKAQRAELPSLLDPRPTPLDLPLPREPRRCYFCEELAIGESWDTPRCAHHLKGPKR